MKHQASNIRTPRHLWLAGLALTALTLAGCPGVETPRPGDDTSDEVAAAAAEALAAETLALEQMRAEATASEEAALAAATKAQAEREEALRLREEQLERQEALRREQARLAERKAEAEARERELAAKEKELENYEANLAFQEKELRDRETLIDETLEAMEVDDAEVAPARQGEPLDPQPSGDEIRPVYASLEPGRLLEIEFEETVSTSTHRQGDPFKGRLVQALTAEDGTLVVPAGAEVVGRVTEAISAKKVGGRASLEVEFTHLVLPSGDTIAISASLVELGTDKRKDKKKIAGAAIVGAILGRVLGGDGAEGVLAGAAAGAAAGTVAVSRQKGKDAEIPMGQTVALQLEEVVTVQVEMTGTVER